MSTISIVKYFNEVARIVNPLADCKLENPVGQELKLWLERLVTDTTSEDTEETAATAKIFIELSRPWSLPEFYNAIHNQWVFTHCIENKDPHFGEKFLATCPGSPIIRQAIGETLIDRIKKALLERLIVNQQGDAKFLFSLLPQKYQHRMEAYVYAFNRCASADLKELYTSENFDDPLYGKHHLEKVFNAEGNPLLYHPTLKAITEMKIKARSIDLELAVPITDPKVGEGGNCNNFYDPHTENLHLYVKLIPDFYRRIQKIYLETIGENAYTTAPNFGEELFQTDPNHSLIRLAADEELGWHVLSQIPQFTSTGNFEVVKNLYNSFLTKYTFPLGRIQLNSERDLTLASLIEYKIWKVWTKRTGLKTDDPEFGKHYIEKYLQDKTNDPIFDEAFARFLRKSPFSPTINYTRFFDENVRGLFYKIEDTEKNVRGYILGSMHLVPLQALKMRRAIAMAFDECNIVLPELYELKDSLEETKEKYIRLEREKKIGIIDPHFILNALYTGKKLASLETRETQETTSNLLTPLLQDIDFNIFNDPLESLLTSLKQQIAQGQMAQVPGIIAAIVCRGLLQAWVAGSEEQMTQQLADVLQWVAQSENALALPFWQKFKERNLSMCEKSIETLNDPSLIPFFLPGASHLVDHEVTGPGIISLLRERGWSVTQI